MITDAHHHAHLLAADTTDGIERSCCCATSPADWQQALDWGAADTSRSVAIGMHPWFLEQTPAGWPTRLEELLRANPKAAVGECGLDKTGRSPAIVSQLAALDIQIAMAIRLERPLILHCVRAYGTLFEVLEAGKIERGVLLHGYGGSDEMTERFASLQAKVYFSVSDPDRIAAIPAERLLLESDASPDNGRLPSHVIELHRETAVDAEQIANNYAELFGA